MVQRVGAAVRRLGRSRERHHPRDGCAALSLLWLVAVREFQNYVVNPHIGRTVGLSPLVTLLSVAVVGVLSGD
jgi:hypothetical protein